MGRDRTGSLASVPGFSRMGTGLANLRGPGRIRVFERNLAQAIGLPGRGWDWYSRSSEGCSYGKPPPSGARVSQF